MLERIIDRIQKLMALTEARGATPEEAASAAAKAQALLFEHNLTMAQVEKAEGASKAASFDKTDFVMDCTKFSVSWHRNLLGGIATANFCKAIFGSGAKAYIIGQKQNVEVVTYLYQYLASTIQGMSKEAVKREGILDHKTRWMRCFCIGAASTVRKRLSEQRATNQHATPECHALVVVTDAQLKQAVSAYFPRLRTLRGSRISNTEGYSAGQEAGRNITINPGITANHRNALALN